MKKFNIIAVLFALLVMFGCTDDFDEINTDPNNPTSDALTNVNPLVTQVQRQGFAEDRFNTWRGNLIFGERFAHQFSFGHSTTWFSDAAGFSYHGGWTDAAWQVPYERVTAAINEILVLTGPEGRLADAEVEAVGKIMKAMLYHRVSDQFGNIPYFEAGTAVATPAFDSQAEIYQDLLTILDEATTTLAASSNATIYGIADGDLAYGGDRVKWLKAGHTLRLRLALRAKNAGSSGAFADAHIADYVGSGAPALLSSNDDVFQVDRDPSIADPVANGYYDIWWTFDPCCGAAAKWVVSETMIDFLKSNSDPRLFAFAMPIEGGTVGVEADYVGGIVGGRSDITSGIPFETLSKPAEQIWNDNTFPYISITYAEAELLLAEANLGTLATAQEHFEAGIRANMEYWGVEEADIVAYLATPAATLSADAATAMQQIGKERWLATYTNGYEAWSIARRFDLDIIPDMTDLTKYAATPTGADNLMPQRLQYGANEAVLNAANIAANGTLPDLMTTRIWWNPTGL